MKFTLLATLALVGIAMAKGIPNGQRCIKDGSIGYCQSGYCEQLAGDNSGICK
ncbi:hypothetical protein EMCG_01764 [[Emmonsia] crescens]|uniref:Invertebrate defensins family profile domain-containing protein n=1 Tax=[Emmonsia] crescens TaxID=73230 RepID=A0A0G2J9F8_9EURO|nr:hypothetical protein EMCG_01764 [Emmonsia crescens UAMH 3008]